MKMATADMAQPPRRAPDGHDPALLAFLILPGFPMACLTSAIEPLRAANEITGRRAFRWQLVSETGERVRSSAEVGFDPDLALADLTRADFVFIMSSPDGQFRDPKRAEGRLRRLDRAGVPLGAFSGGIFPLARSGLMEGRRCSVHWCYDAAFRAEFPQIEAQSSVITIDRRRHTASGSAAVFELMLGIIADRLGERVMTEVACWFQHPLMRSAEVRQSVPAHGAGTTADRLPPAVSEAIRLFAQHIEDPIHISDVARAMSISTRQLDRTFKRATGLSPLRYYRAMRLERARQMVRYSNEPMGEIALAVGYTSSAWMARHYREMFGAAPQDERREANTIRVSESATVPAF
jgi:AraC family transcriptional regulator, glycine betaine-responsive activator